VFAARAQLLLGWLRAIVAGCRERAGAGVVLMLVLVWWRCVGAV